MRYRCALFVLAAGCADSPAAKPSTEATFDVQVTLTAAIDMVTVDGAPAAILPFGQGRMVDPTVKYPNYEDALVATPLEIVFLSQGQPMFIGHAQAGACQNVCAQEQCADLSKFTSEHIEVMASNFAVKQFDTLLCMGPSGTIGATP